MFCPTYRTNNSCFVLLLLCGMVHSGVAFAPEVVDHDILGSTAFNVAMFAMGWAATRWASTVKGKGNDPLLCLHWIKAMASMPLALLPPRSPPAAACCEPAAAVDGDWALPLLETPLLCLENEVSENDTLLAGLGSLLACRISAADTSELPPWRRSCFHSKGSSETQLVDYLAHIHWFFECSSPCLVIALIYLDRVLSSDTKITLCAETCPRLVLTCLLAALKFHDDDWTPYPNAFYANMGDVDVGDLNAMEKHFCKSIDWHFFVRPEEYLHYHDLIATAAPTTAN